MLNLFIILVFLGTIVFTLMYIQALTDDTSTNYTESPKQVKALLITINNFSTTLLILIVIIIAAVLILDSIGNTTVIKYILGLTNDWLPLVQPKPEL